MALFWRIDIQAVETFVVWLFNWNDDFAEGSQHDGHEADQP